MNKQVKSTETEFKPFKQVPTWEPDTKFEITGKEMTAIQDMLEAYGRFIPVIEQMLIDQLNAGKIAIKYVGIDGNEISKDEIGEMLKRFATEMSVEPKI